VAALPTFLDLGKRTEVVEIDDHDIVTRLKLEVLHGLGLLDDTGRRPVKGVTVDAKRTGGRAGQGGYRITVTRDLSAMDQARLPAPDGKVP
jgi:hypothetical protein